MIEKICTTQVIGRINNILVQNPELIEEWQSIALAGIIDGKVIEAKEFVPIDNNEFKERLLT